jgi:hypothetical protein
MPRTGLALHHTGGLAAFGRLSATMLSSSVSPATKRPAPSFIPWPRHEALHARAVGGGQNDAPQEGADRGLHGAAFSTAFSVLRR